MKTRRRRLLVFVAVGFAAVVGAAVVVSAYSGDGVKTSSHSVSCPLGAPGCAPPVVVIESPSAGATTGSMVHVSGRVLRASGVQVRVASGPWTTAKVEAGRWHASAVVPRRARGRVTTVDARVTGAAAGTSSEQTTVVDSSTEPACPVGSRASVRVSGSQTTRYRQADLREGTSIDASTAVWRGVHDYPVHLAGGGRICWSGGTIEGTYSNSTSWDTLHGTGALNLFAPGSTLDEVRVHNYGDGLRILDGARQFRIRAAHLSFVRDDCIENDYLYSGLVVDSLLDGCYVAFSARTHSGNDGSGLDGRNETWAIHDSLVRLQPMPTVYRGNTPGHGGFFKWNSDGLSPKLSLHGNIFRADQDSNHTTMGIPSGALADCSDNVMVWLGPGPYPEPLPSCFRVTKDKAVWDAAVADWRARNG